MPDSVSPHQGRLRRLAALLASVALLALSARLDGFAGNIPQADMLRHISRFLSLLGNGIFLLPLIGVLYIAGLALKNNRLKDSGKDGALSFIIAGVVVQILKLSFERPRPGQGGASIIGLIENSSLFDFAGRFNSFPSGHTAVSFALAYVLSRHYRRAWPVFYTVAFLIALSRVYLGSHFPTDIAAGALTGIAAGWLGVSAVNTQRLKAAFFILVLALTFFKSNGLLLFDVDEAVFSEASREMVETGDIITPSYNYEPRFDKPIFFYWAAALSYKLLGVSEFSARLPSGVFGLGLVLMTFYFLKRVKGELPAYIASLVLLLNIEYFIYSHSAVTDMTLAFFIAAAIFSFYLSTIEDSRLWPYAFWASAGFAALTKGAVGLLFPIAIALLYSFLSKGARANVRRLLKPLPVLVFFIIAVPWYAAVSYMNGMEFFNAFVLKHHIQRFSSVISSHSGPAYYYLPVLAIGFFPWAGLLPTALRGAYLEWRDKEPGLLLLSSIWFSFIFLFFSVASTKLPNYIFPAVPGASIMAGLVLSGLFKAEPKTLLRSAGPYMIAALSIAFAVALVLLPSLDIKTALRLEPSLFHTLAVMFALSAIAALVAVKRPVASFVALCVIIVSIIGFLRLRVLPPINLYMQKDLYTYSSYAKKLGRGFTFAAYELNRPSLAFYSQRKVVRLEKSISCDIREHSKSGGLLIITEKKRLGELDEYGFTIIDQRGDYALLSNREGLAPID